MVGFAILEFVEVLSAPHPVLKFLVRRNEEEVDDTGVRVFCTLTSLSLPGAIMVVCRERNIRKCS